MTSWKFLFSQILLLDCVKAKPVKVSQHHLIVYLHFSCVGIPTAVLECGGSMVLWLTGVLISHLDQSVWAAVAELWIFSTAWAPHCFGCGAALTLH